MQQFLQRFAEKGCQGGTNVQAQACLRNSQAVAVCMGSDLRRGMLACSLYAAREGAAGNLQALGDAMSRFLEEPAEAPPAGASPPGWDSATLERVSEEDDDDFVDPYLRLPDFPPCTWSPLISYMVRGRILPCPVVPSARSWLVFFNQSYLVKPGKICRLCRVTITLY